MKPPRQPRCLDPGWIQGNNNVSRVLLISSSSSKDKQGKQRSISSSTNEKVSPPSSSSPTKAVQDSGVEERCSRGETPNNLTRRTPCTPFAFFVDTCGRRIKRNYKKSGKLVDLDMSELIEVCTERWSSMTPVEKKRFEQMSEYDKTWNRPMQSSSRDADFTPAPAKLEKRRSERKSPQEIEKENLVILKGFLDVRDDSQHGLTIIQTETKGRGVMAARQFSVGEMIVEYAGDLVDEGLNDNLQCTNNSQSQVGGFLFFFRHTDRKFCIDASQESDRYGRLVNHSRRKANAVVKILEVNKVPRLVLVAKRMIEVGEEVLYDYGDRTKEALQAHPWLKE